MSNIRFYKELTQKVIDALVSRQGFDSVWADIDDDIREEIKEEIASIIEGAHEGP